MPRRFAGHAAGGYFLLAILVHAVPAQLNQAPTAAAVRGIVTEVFPAEQRAQLARMLPDQHAQRLQRAIQTSRSDWSNISSRQDWEQFRDERLLRLRRSLGRFPAAPASPDVRVTAELVGDGYLVRNLVFESRPGLWVTANLYLPEKKPNSMPGILISHSHHTPKEHGELQDMGMTWARRGCAVLVPDHLGHGERRQHDFRKESDFDGDFRLSRQDYFFRYDAGIQLHLVGESLMGWMVWDLMRGVDVLLAQTSVDPQRIILLGAVAGGGDPAAVAAALDRRIAAAVVFNFGGPQPETPFPLPADAETSFDYAGSGSWESTRNLRRSAADGFLPWVIVGSILPRRLIYAHEFAWDQPRDPVWRRLQSIDAFFDHDDRLAFTHGHGELRQTPPQASHCTHIGRAHRVLIHDALRKWFGVQVGSEHEFSQQRATNELTCLTAELESTIRPSKLHELLGRMAEAQLAESRQRRQGLSIQGQRDQIGAQLAQVLGVSRDQVPAVTVVSRESQWESGIKVDRIVLKSEPDIVVPLLLLMPAAADQDLPTVIGISQLGKRGFLQHRADEIAELLSAHIAVCLPDLRGTGETRADNDRDRTSSDTACSSTELMLGGTLVGARLVDLRAVMRYLRERDDLASDRVGLWGESLAATNPPTVQLRIPHGVTKPPQSEPLGDMLALIAPLFEPDIRCVYSRGGLRDFRSVLSSSYTLVPHDIVVPELLTVTDLPEIATLLTCPLRRDQLVDSANRLLPNPSATSPATWLRLQLQ